MGYSIPKIGILHFYVTPIPCFLTNHDAKLSNLCFYSKKNGLFGIYICL